MALNETGIVWTDYTYNFWKGCAKISEGCKNCWAEDIMTRFGHTPEDWTIENIDDNLSVSNHVPTDEIRSLDEGRWIFTPSTSDPCLPWLPAHVRRAWVDALHDHDQHCYQLLTKWGAEKQGLGAPVLPDNAMLGVSVESPRRKYRIDWLREQDANMKFVSFEPLVEEIEKVNLTGIDWVIVGGESHPNPRERREMEPEWAARLFRIARNQDVPFLFKQHSGPHAEEERRLLTAGSFKKQYNEFPETPDGIPDAPQEFL